MVLQRSVVVVCLALGLSACKKEEHAGTSSDPKTVQSTTTPPVEIEILYGSEKKTWLEEQLRAFEQGSRRSRRAYRSSRRRPARS
jgi:hypothetical protein